MKRRIVYVAVVAAMTCAMAWAQSSQSNSQGTADSQTPAAQSASHTDAQGDLPAVKEGEAQSGKSGNASPADERPASMGAPETPNAGATPKGETPATGAQTEEKGKAAGDDERPGVNPANGTENPK